LFSLDLHIAIVGSGTTAILAFTKLDVLTQEVEDGGTAANIVQTAQQMRRQDGGHYVGQLGHPVRVSQRAQPVAPPHGIPGVVCDEGTE